MARRKNKGRPVNGVLLLDKPAGISSTDICVNEIYPTTKSASKVINTVTGRLIEKLGNIPGRSSDIFIALFLSC